MGKRGPKPMPTVMRIVTGNARKVTINENEPVAPLSGIDPPSYLDGLALEKWNETVPKLIDAGLLTDLDREMWARYCVNWALWWKNHQLVERGGDLRAVGNQGHVAQSPWYIQMKGLQAELYRIEIQFGMTPSARSSIQLHSRREHDPFDSFVQSRGAG